MRFLKIKIHHDLIVEFAVRDSQGITFKAIEMYFTFKESLWLYLHAYCLFIIRGIRLVISDLDYSFDASFWAFRG